LSSLLESAFRDDIRNGISHADYVIWSDGLRLRKRNGGNPDLVSFDHVYEALERGAGFFQILREYNAASVRSFNPPKTIVGRLSANFPMPWTVSFDPKLGSLGISGSSPGPVSSPEYERQSRINGLLGGRVMATYTTESTAETESVYAYLDDVRLDEKGWVALIDDIGKLNLWDVRRSDEGAVRFFWRLLGVSAGSVLQRP
jgi:hypothetical protein